MKRRTFLGTIPAAAVAAAPQLSPSAPKAGFAERDITPEIGMECPGNYTKIFHKSLHDPCKVRAAVFDDGATRVALVGVDALMVPRQLVLSARQAIRARCGIPPEAILVGASHSHSSGPTGMVQPGQYDHASPFVRTLAYEKTSAAHPGYLKRVENEIVEAVCAADRARAPHRIGFGAGVEAQAAYNRRFRMRNGLTYTHPGKGNPDIVGVAGPIDPAVTVTGCWNAAGELTGCIVNYACHATTSPGGISANWIYWLERTIRGSFGPNVVVVFLAGFCGDVTQVNNLDPYGNPSGEKWSQIVGGRVGAEAVKVLHSMYAAETLKVAAAHKVEMYGRRIPSPQRVRKCTEIAKKDPKEVGATEWVFAKEIVLLDALAARWPKEEVELQAIQTGPVVYLAAPGEMFCQLGLDLRARSRFPFTAPVELANGCVGYVPTEEALAPGGGGYETRLTSYSNLEPKAGTRMVDGLTALMAGFKPEPAPTRPKAAPFKEPWSYGNVPPELS